MKGAGVTLGQDARLVHPYGQGRPLPAESLTGIAVPTWVGWGQQEPGVDSTANQRVARLLVDSHVTTAVLDKQTHLVKPPILAAELIAHFRGAAGQVGPPHPPVPQSAAAAELR